MQPELIQGDYKRRSGAAPAPVEAPAEVEKVAEAKLLTPKSGRKGAKKSPAVGPGSKKGGAAAKDDGGALASSPGELPKHSCKRTPKQVSEALDALKVDDPGGGILVQPVRG